MADEVIDLTSVESDELPLKAGKDLKYKTDSFAYEKMQSTHSGSKEEVIDLTSDNVLKKSDNSFHEDSGDTTATLYRKANLTKEEAMSAARDIFDSWKPSRAITDSNIVIVDPNPYAFDIPHDFEGLNASYDGTVIKDEKYWRNRAIKRAMKELLRSKRNHSHGAKAGGKKATKVARKTKSCKK